MIRPILVFSTATAFAAAAIASTDESSRLARVRFVEQLVAVQHTAESEADDAVSNAPLLPGDRVWSYPRGRAEFQLFDGTLLWLDARSMFDYVSSEQTATRDQVSLRLWSGALTVRASDSSTARIDIETAAATVLVDGSAFLRIDVSPGRTRVTVREGSAAIDSDDGVIQLQAGACIEVREGQPPESPWITSGSDADEFDAWVDERDMRAPASADAAVDSAQLLVSESDSHRLARGFDVTLGTHQPPPVAATRIPALLRRPERQRERARIFAAQRAVESFAERDEIRSSASTSSPGDRPDALTRGGARGGNTAEHPGVTTRVGALPRWADGSRARQEEPNASSARPQAEGPARARTAERRPADREHREAPPPARDSSPSSGGAATSSHASSEPSRSASSSLPNSAGLSHASSYSPHTSRDSARERHPSHSRD
jgi:hypothetical protein